MAEEAKSPAYDLAKQKVDAIIGFKVHLIVYLGVNALLLIINLACLSKTAKLPSGDVVNLPFIAYFWAMWPILGWGVGVVIHYLVVRKFTGPPSNWKETQIEKFMAQSGKQE